MSWESADIALSNTLRPAQKLSEPMMARLPTLIYITQPPWANLLHITGLQWKFNQSEKHIWSIYFWEKQTYFLQNVPYMKVSICVKQAEVWWGRWKPIGFIVGSEFISSQLDYTLQWRHNEHDGVSNHQTHNCLLKRLFRCRSKKTSKSHVTGLCAGGGNSLVTCEFPTQMTRNVEKVSIWWRHHVYLFWTIPCWVPSNDHSWPTCNCGWHLYK